jgi:hypothetical protein
VHDKNTLSEDQMFDLYEAVELPHNGLPLDMPETPTPVEHEQPLQELGREKKVFSRDQLSASIQRLRSKGKSYKEIARGLNQINVATLSGHREWTTLEVQTLLPALVNSSPRHFTEGNNA